ncbi:hypothetical protein PVK06_042803 [Gossypium arboreum]|uniref:Uncharacterized protein n=1 Tax=Gossypium arboreum TaxID=29729 RepID=A0ABR0MM55_GOSAR|nr:hypothetical protein PVK06_042803 [Gossypium arboreum]
MSSDRDGNKVVEEMVSKEDFGSWMVVEIDLGDILGKRRKVARDRDASLGDKSLGSRIILIADLKANNEGDNNDGREKY